MAPNFPIEASAAAVQVLIKWARLKLAGKQPRQPRVGVTIQSEFRLDSEAKPDLLAIMVENQIRNMTGGLGILGHDTQKGASHPEMQLPDFSFMNTCLAHTVGRGDQLVLAGSVNTSSFSPFGNRRRKILDALEDQGLITYIGNGSILTRAILAMNKETFKQTFNPDNIRVTPEEKERIFDILHGAGIKTQIITESPWSLESKEFAPLGLVADIPLLADSPPEPTYGFLFLPSMHTLDVTQEELLGQSSPTVLFAVERNGISDVFYPPNGSIPGLQSQRVLGEASFRLIKKLGLLEPQDPAATMIIQDCHGAIATFAHVEDLYAQFCKQGMPPKEAWEKALNVGRRSHITTIHAPQPETVNCYGEQVVRTVYPKEPADRLMALGHPPDNWTHVNTLVLAMELSFGITCVSPAHLRMTLDRTNRLIPAHFLDRADRGHRIFRETSNIVDPETWMPEEQKALLDEIFPGWRGNPEIFNRPEALGTLLFNPKWRETFLKIQAAGTAKLFQALKARQEAKPDLFPGNLNEDAIIVGAMRRATEYKLNLLIKILESKSEGIKDIVRRYGPVLFLLGGLAPKGDVGAEAALSRLLELIKRINREGEGVLQAAFWENYNEYNSNVVLQGVDIWGMFSDPLSDVRNSEAFGPSGAKASILGKLPLGFSDGWGPCFNLLGMGATIVPPYTVIGEADTRRQLAALTHTGETQAAAREIAMTGWLFHFNNLCGLVRQEKMLRAQGLGHLAASLALRTAAVVNGLGNFHPRLLLQKYAALAKDILSVPDEPPAS